MDLAALEDLNKVQIDDFLHIDLPRRTDRILDIAWRDRDVRPLRREGKVHRLGPKLARGVAGVVRAEDQREGDQQKCEDLHRNDIIDY